MIIKPLPHAHSTPLVACLGLPNENVTRRCKGEILIQNALLVTSSHFQKPEGCLQGPDHPFQQLVMQTVLAIFSSNEHKWWLPVNSNQLILASGPPTPGSSSSISVQDGWAQQSRTPHTINLQLESKLSEPKHKHLRMNSCWQFKMISGPLLPKQHLGSWTRSNDPGLLLSLQSCNQLFLLIEVKIT